MDIGLTTLQEEDIAKHIPAAHALLQRATVIIPDDDSRSKVELAGTRRRFVSTVSTSNLKRTADVKILNTISGVHADDEMLSVEQHRLAFKLRRAIAVGLAVVDVFSRQTELESLTDKNKASALSGDSATRYHKLLSSAAFVALFTAGSYLLQTIDGDADATADTPDPSFIFDTPHDAAKSFLYGLDSAIDGAPDDAQLLARAKAFARATLEGLMARHARFDDVKTFDEMRIRLDSDDFTLSGLSIEERSTRKPLIMTFKKPEEVVGNHIAKYQSIKLAKMLMAYDFDKQLNPFVEMGGFLFTFIGDGFPGTGKTTLIQMIAGLIKDYCDMAGYTFHYENFGIDQISSYQGKSGQNCKQFVSNVMDPRVIGFGTVDDIDQVAAKRSDDRASAGQQEVTGVLMESFSGANTVVRGNCSFGMFSNYPENVDDALRQRAGARWLVDGPQTAEDYIDIFALLAGKNHSVEVGGHELYATQEIERAVSTAYEQHNEPQEPRLQKVHTKFQKAHGKPETLKEIGLYLHAIKEAEPRFTGRAIKNITDAAKMRAMDIELPDEWFEEPDVFVRQPYETKMEMIAELRGEISLDMIIQEIHRYADSEFRYTEKSDATAVDEAIRNLRVRERAAAEIEVLKEKGQWNA